MIIRQHDRIHLADSDWLMCNVLILSGTKAPDDTEVDCKDCLRRRKLRKEAR
ncbi:hypothetical protein [Nocardiopsis synnemataformans]|uniref:hypothetical protein n=1 Tax=Nocardiopsis synnemataformans TaxID=61305 RepID=UPI003EC02669